MTSNSKGISSLQQVTYRRIQNVSAIIEKHKLHKTLILVSLQEVWTKWEIGNFRTENAYICVTFVHRKNVVEGLMENISVQDQDDEADEIL